MEPCVICGRVRTDEAHVHAKEWWTERGEAVPPNHAERNIIHLCGSDHDDFDNLRVIGIAPNKLGFVVLELDHVVFKMARYSIEDLRDDYIVVRNAHCVRRVRLALGIVPGYEARKIW
jgi:hypothetical protein